MIFMFDVEFDGLTERLGHAVADECRAAQAWPVAFVPSRVEKRWFGVTKAFPSVLEILTHDALGSILAPAAARDAAAVAMRIDAVEPLSRTLAILAERVPAGFVFRATWAGSPILYDEHLTTATLVRRVQASTLNEFTRYHVGPHRWS